MKFNTWLDHRLLGPLQFAALLTWLVIGYFALFSRPVDETQGRATLFAAIALLGFLVAMFTAWAAPEGRLDVAGLIAMPVSLVFACWFQPTQLLLILMCIFAGTLPYFLSILRSLGVVAAVHFLLVGVISLRSDSSVWLFSLTNLGFAVFALFSSHSVMRERAAREELNSVHQQLLATQQLLTERALEDERLRISRDLHDSLGHHLTALSLQLEVARHMTQDGARDHISQAQGLARLLLSDVRQVVTDLRDASASSLRDRIAGLAQTARPVVEMDIDEAAYKLSYEQEEAMFRAAQEIITNCNRHSHCERLTISLEQQPDQWLLTATEDAQSPVSLIWGHGLRGLQERINALGGSVELDTKAGLNYRILIPA